MTVENKSTKTRPEYRVTISYVWKKPYLASYYDDAIVVEWGGNLLLKEASTSVKYYDYNILKWKWEDYTGERTMSMRQLGRNEFIFFFPQNNGSSSFATYDKTKKGHVTFTLYQKSKKNYDTKITSFYCHKNLFTGKDIDDLEGDAD
ncbi:MAG: hypothetical protein ACOYJJ_05910 [Anaerovoracaceae bacterium]|jgi:hypothetical protein